MELDPEIVRELVATFALELEEQLQVITDELLKLERGLEGAARTHAYEAVFRAAHNVKGAARGVGADAVCELSHRLETLFSELKKRGVNPATAVIDTSLAVLDAMRQINGEWEPGKPLADDLQALYEQVMERLGSVDAGKTEATKENHEGTSEADVETAGNEDPTGESAEAPAPASKSSSGSDVVRVDRQRLDSIAAVSEELEMARIELEDRVACLRRLERGITRLYRDLRRQHIAVAEGLVESGGESAQFVESALDGVAGLSREAGANHIVLRNSVRRLGQLSTELDNDVNMLRLVRASNLLRPLVRSVRDMARELGKDVDFEVSGDEVEMDRTVLEGIKDPLTHLLRNAIDHGIENKRERKQAAKAARGRVTLAVRRSGSRIQIEISDDGAGIDADRVVAAAVERDMLSAEQARAMSRAQKLEVIFRPGFSSREKVTRISGRGVGLDVVKANIQRLKGTVRVDSTEGEGTVFLLDLPLTLASDRGLIVRAGGDEVVIPSTAIEQVMELPVEELVSVEASDAVMFRDRPLPLRDLAVLLERAPTPVERDRPLSLVIISHGWHMVALLVEEIVRDRDIVIKPFSGPLVSVRNVSGATTGGMGGIMMVLNPADLIQTALGTAAVSGLPSSVEDDDAEPPHILVVDDSITTRMLERSILEKNGYRVTVATHGKQAWELIQDTAFDLVVTDVQMPLMDGLELTATIKRSEKFNGVPVIIVTSLGNEEDKRRGIEVGADAYIVKSQFETGALLDLVRQMVGP